jgi:prepilin-type N-terminal cleavage/methylation domain-containing protein
MPKSRTAGFTLIELLIAIVLSSMLIMVAVAGLRVTAQAVVSANRMSMNNTIMRVAVTAANEEMDFWDSYDSPTDLSRQKLRKPGMPFQPLDFITANTVLDFDHSHARQWWNGHVWSSNHRRWGDYSIYGKQGLIDPLVPVERQWRHTLLPYLSNNLGYFAAMDYLPANFIFGFYANNGIIPPEFGSPSPGFGLGQFHSLWRNRYQPLGKCEAGHGGAFLVTTVASPIGYPNCLRAVYAPYGGQWDWSNLSDWNLNPKVDFLSSGQPDHWPHVTIRTSVAYSWANFIHESQITINDPLSGETVSMIIKGLTTTLRGARRQRGLDTEPINPLYP